MESSQRRCYHDDIEGDCPVEVAREADISREGVSLINTYCEKNPGHVGFIPFTDLKLEELPEIYRRKDIFDEIKDLGERVVRLVIGGTKLASGFVDKIDNQYFIRTNNHVIKTQEEVENCEIEFKYDSLDRSSVIISKGVKLLHTCRFRDRAMFTFYPVPDFIKQLNIVDIGEVDPIVTVIYKDGMKINTRGLYNSLKRGHFRTGLNLNDPDIFIAFLTFPGDFISYLTSQYILFQPVSAIPLLANIEITLNTGRVIPGKCINLGDLAIVKTDEQLQQDEIKKCKAMLNGEVVGRGLRLYFESKDACKYFSRYVGIDREDKIALFPDGVWLYGAYPLPPAFQTYIQKIPKIEEHEGRTKLCVLGREFYIEDFEMLKKTQSYRCVIGHPHGNIKHVTFGINLGETIERFDRKGVHITNPDSKCTCMEVKCKSYSCKTCPGSSGSPVKFGMVPNHLTLYHFMGYNVPKYTRDGHIIENINLGCF